ncbi:MAG: hypothetical protein JO112_19935 [Planctomycetes bacterium]|nr:hypothetical protein [Planctomycetota bacterium]
MNYTNIAKAVEFYTERGYVYLDDAPWNVRYDAYTATKPEGAKDVFYSTKDGPTLHPVASGEQSFIQMMLDGQSIKRAICVTPCHRAEPRIDTLHRPYFMKAELINADNVDDGHLIHMVHEACSFFEQFFPVRVIRTSPAGEVPMSFDIVEKGTRFELGSYGIREVKIGGRRLDWIYGTACAEPRLSTAIAKHSKAVGR